MIRTRQNELLTREQCTVLKGLAILMIMLHNLCHWLPGAIVENEYSLGTLGTKDFFRYFMHPDANWPLQLFSFLGHYGVPVFVFLSAYGLVKKYENPRREAVGAAAFIASHFWKIFLMCLTGLVLLIFIRAAGAPFNFHGVFDWETNNIRYVIAGQWALEQLSLTINFLLPFNQGRYVVGPYWYFGFVMQLYILYRIFLYTRDHDSRLAQWGPVAFIIFAVAMMYVGQFAISRRCLMYLRYNFFAGAIPFAMGLLAARYEHRLPSFSTATLLATVVVTAIAVPLSNLSFHTWIWSAALVVIGAIALAKILPAILSRPLLLVGIISMPLFIAHPIMRMLFRDIAHTPVPYQLVTAYFLISIAAATILHFLKKLF